MDNLVGRWCRNWVMWQLTRIWFNPYWYSGPGGASQLPLSSRCVEGWWVAAAFTCYLHKQQVRVQLLDREGAKEWSCVFFFFSPCVNSGSASFAKCPSKDPIFSKDSPTSSIPVSNWDDLSIAIYPGCITATLLCHCCYDDQICNFFFLLYLNIWYIIRWGKGVLVLVWHIFRFDGKISKRKEAAKRKAFWDIEECEVYL